ncbi:MAG: arginyl-tRNA synthetase [Herbinix sp.]|nr:arginyl-tRNA synthetase [Herbinix sp.]
MKQKVIHLIEHSLQDIYGISLPDTENYVEIPTNIELGDFSLPCFTLAKTLKKSPKVIAEELCNHVNYQNNDNDNMISEAKAVNGYLNIFIDRAYFIEQIITDVFNTSYGSSEIGNGKTICMDYSSPNIAKNFHIGHLRTTLIGNSLAKIYSKLGYKVVRINYLGDWGTQFGKLIVAYKKWSNKKIVEEKGIEELLRLYILFGKEAESNPELNDEARAWFTKMEHGNEEALSLWQWFKDISLIEFDRVYKMLHIEFDSYVGESFYMDKVPALVTELKNKKLLVESQGANIINLDDFGMPPCLITKKDGSSIYHSRDIAAALYRKQTYHFEKCLYVTGMEQRLHFSQVFKAIELMGYEWASDLYHIPYGLVSMGGEKLSTRKGNVLYAEDILNEAVSRALNAIEEKNPDLHDKLNTAKKIGIGAVIFHDLSNQLIRDVQFKWDEVLNFDGMTAPYIQYTYARSKSILRKSPNGNGDVDLTCLTDSISYELVKKLALYPDIVKDAAVKFEPYIIARYAYALSNLFNKFYHECRILNADDNIKKSRIVLVDAVQKVICDSMSLLGIECPEEM